MPKKMTPAERKAYERDLKKYEAMVATIREKLGRDEVNLGLPNRHLALIQTPKIITRRRPS